VTIGSDIGFRQIISNTRANKFWPVAGHGEPAFPNAVGYQRQVRTFWSWYNTFTKPWENIIKFLLKLVIASTTSSAIV
jgi:hypothetical protein